ncbi:hypothetical protein [Aestuariivirga sp.]|uniref:hypothetical protein n=1 Tax=Aestuariivirga sp. TaxID=2650926 RepID=UPI0025BEB2B5|nr:hypothetical protein [Aestuariivirga sp.]MCA3555134.1 hypothetical protein [Aestuariivirga sp.]
MLMGAHCVSPVEQGAMMTQATKVQCAVMIEKDTDRGTLVVTPPDAASEPQVAAAMTRFAPAAGPAGPQDSGPTRIVPASAPAGAPASEIKLPPAGARPAALTALPADQPDGAMSPPPDTKAAPVADTTVATLVPPPPKRPAAAAGTPKRNVQPAAARKPVQCKSGTVSRWTRTADGKRLYRCVTPGGDSALSQIY